MKNAVVTAVILMLVAAGSGFAQSTPDSIAALRSADLAAVLRNAKGWTGQAAFALKDGKADKFMAMRTYKLAAQGDDVSVQVVLSLDKPALVSGTAPVGAVDQTPPKLNLTIRGVNGYYDKAGPIHRITLSLCNSTSYSCSFMASGTATKAQLISLLEQLPLARVAAIADSAFR